MGDHGETERGKGGDSMNGEMMDVVCSWCGRDMGQKMGPAGQVSHGMCRDCYEREVAKLPKVVKA